MKKFFERDKEKKKKYEIREFCELYKEKKKEVEMLEFIIGIKVGKILGLNSDAWLLKRITVMSTGVTVEFERKQFIRNDMVRLIFIGWEEML